MRPRALRRSLTAVGLLLSLARCSHQEELTAIHNDIDVLRKQWLVNVSQLKSRLDDADQEIDYLVDLTPACKYRSGARKLVHSCHDMTCNLDGLTAGLNQLHDMTDGFFMVGYVRSSDGAQGFSPERLKEVARLLVDRPRRPHTRWLLLTLPPNDSGPARDRAGQVAQDLVALLSSKNPGLEKLRNIGALAVTCDQAMRNAFSFYTQRHPPTGNEPRSGDIIKIIVLRVDCAEP